MEFEDLSGKIRVIVFPKDYVRFAREFIPGWIGFIRGTINHAETGTEVFLSDVRSLDDYLAAERVKNTS